MEAALNPVGEAGEAMQKDAEALYNEGMSCYSKGDVDGAVRCLREAGKQGDEPAVHALIDIYLDSPYEIKAKEFIGEVEGYAANGFASAMFCLGVLRTGFESRFYDRFLGKFPDYDFAGEVDMVEGLDWIDRTVAKDAELWSSGDMSGLVAEIHYKCIEKTEPDGFKMDERNKWLAKAEFYTDKAETEIMDIRGDSAYIRHKRLKDPVFCGGEAFAGGFSITSFHWVRGDTLETVNTEEMKAVIDVLHNLAYGHWNDAGIDRIAVSENVISY